jgi:hypothetical protein
MTGERDTSPADDPMSSRDWADAAGLNYASDETSAVDGTAKGAAPRRQGGESARWVLWARLAELFRAIRPLRPFLKLLKSPDLLAEFEKLPGDLRGP